MSTPNNICLEPYQLDIFHQIATEKGFTRYTIEASAGTNLGDGHSGVLLRIRIRGEQGANAAAELSLMLKMPPATNKARREILINLFERESHMYRQVLPHFHRFQREKGVVDDGFFLIPQCLAIVCDRSQDRYAIVMEDLRVQGFEMFRKCRVIDEERLRLVMQELGRFHAVSFALHDQRHEVFGPIVTNMSDMFLELIKSESMKPFHDLCFDKAIDALRENEVGLRAKVGALRRGFVDEIERCVRIDGGHPFSVLNHGDCWTNNVMYLTDDKKVQF